MEERNSPCRYPVLPLSRPETCTQRQAYGSGCLAGSPKGVVGSFTGSRPHSFYVHVELPAKREAIRKLDEWFAAQLSNLEAKEGKHDSTKTDRPEVRIDESI